MSFHTHWCFNFSLFPPQVVRGVQEVRGSKHPVCDAILCVRAAEPGERGGQHPPGGHLPLTQVHPLRQPRPTGHQVTRLTTRKREHRDRISLKSEKYRESVFAYL